MLCYAYCKLSILQNKQLLVLIIYAARKSQAPSSPEPEHEEEEESPESPDPEHHDHQGSGASNSGDSRSNSGIQKNIVQNRDKKKINCC